MTDKDFQKWIKERDRIAKTYDVEKFKDSYRKWSKKGLYTLRLPADNVIEISMRKMVYHMTSSTEDEKNEAKKWLEDHGSSTDL